MPDPQDSTSQLVWYRVQGSAHAYAPGGATSLCQETQERGLPVGFGAAFPRNPCKACVHAIERRSWQPNMETKAGTS